MLTDGYTLYGVPVSLYTGKARSYLRTQSIDFVEMSPGSDRYLNHIVPAVGRWIIPCLETPDGTIIQDGADIIDHFDVGEGVPLRRSSVRPDSPTLLGISHLFEIFGGEGRSALRCTIGGTSTSRTSTSSCRSLRSTCRSR
jgi:hypothetical protein